MQNLYDEVASLDKRCYKQFHLSEDLLMEHAAEGMSNYIRTHFEKNSPITIVCGGGNNGADGITLGRLLHADFKVSLFHVKPPKSPMALLQKKRADAIGISTCKTIPTCDVLVDAIVGTGFDGEFNQDLQNILKEMNNAQAFKIACDVPSGLQANGTVAEHTFIADISLTMGALKKSMFLDEAKDFIGDIQVIDLGVSRDIYEVPSSWRVLDLEDLALPLRDKKNSHKGSFGHLALICGEKAGATIMSAKAAFRFGVGLVTLIDFNNTYIPHEIMQSTTLPYNATALALGMGLGNAFSDSELEKLLDNNLPIIADADILHTQMIIKILQRENVVITPHAKEFVSLLKITALADISIEELQKNRFKYAELFTQSFPHVTLLLKGANVIIAQNGHFFINPHGNATLAKGGSGDVLAGLISALIAQKQNPLEATINASLAHTQLARLFKGANFALTPEDLIRNISYLHEETSKMM